MSEAKASTYTTEQISAMGVVEFCALMQTFTKDELVVLVGMIKIQAPDATAWALTEESRTRPTPPLTRPMLRAILERPGHE